MFKKEWSLVALLAISLVSLISSAAFAQPPGAAEELAACGLCGGTVGAMILIPIVILVLNVALLIWVARDAKARGMDSSVLWMILVMITSVIGLVIYIYARPQGELVGCPNCHNNRLKVSKQCPHCGSS